MACSGNKRISAVAAQEEQRQKLLVPIHFHGSIKLLLLNELGACQRALVFFPWLFIVLPESSTWKCIHVPRFNLLLVGCLFNFADEKVEAKPV